MVRNADAQCFIHRVRHAVLHGQSVILCKTIETLDAGVTVPRPQAKGIEMVDAVGYAEPLHERFEPDAARYDEGEGVVAECLKHAA